LNRTPNSDKECDKEESIDNVTTEKLTTIAALLGVLIVVDHAAGQNVAVGGCAVSRGERGIHLTNGDGVIDVDMIRPDTVRVDLQPEGHRSARTLVVDPRLAVPEDFRASVQSKGNSVSVATSKMSVSVVCGSELEISIKTPEGKSLLKQTDPLHNAGAHRAAFTHAVEDELYGMSGLSMEETGGGLLRTNGAEITAGAQGKGGAPWFFTTQYGVLIDSDGGKFKTRDDVIEFQDESRADLEYFAMVGGPVEVISALSAVTGRPPMAPKWTLGFINSQFGSDEQELHQIVSQYRSKRIPLDALVLDFDWKAWGEDNYGEWRWNSTSSSGNVAPNKFPGGASGDFAKQLRTEGVKVAGILKPRVMLYKSGNSNEMHEAAAYAETHNLWYPGEPAARDYFTNRAARDLDFSKAETRSWYWDHLKPVFNTGMAGWWNDEADVTDVGNGHSFYFDNFQFMNMARCLYEGQRSDSNQRVWSINRTFYLGAQRYGYAGWSGDIQTGFQSMSHERMRMLTAQNLGEAHWSMDTGGFFGHPSPENYARWMEFAAFIPIDRVHGDLGEKRQPWLYGPAAESAATSAIRLRYELLPYIYSYERISNETGIGIVRPLFWIFPDDPKMSNESSSWMFGDSLLVSPVVTRGETVHKVYLPAGTWYDYFKGTRLKGGQTISYGIDSTAWKDIPLFVRSGSILASQPWQNYVDEHHFKEVTIDVFPGSGETEFLYYDDDGETYAYEQGVFYRQAIHARQDKHSTWITFDQPSGSYSPSLQSYVIRIHGAKALNVVRNGKPLRKLPLGSPNLATSTKDDEWSTGYDRFGCFTALRIPAKEQSQVELQLTTKAERGESMASVLNQKRSQ
jgi:alpha-glucosidase